MTRIQAALAVALLCLAGAGCSDPQPPPRPVVELVWPTLAVGTTHDEPEPARGDLLVAWAGPVFAVSSPGESGMPVSSVVADGTAYTTGLGLGWQRTPLQEGVAAGKISNRLLLWDVRALLSAADSRVTQAGGWTNVTGSGSLRLATGELQFMLEVSARGGRVESASVSSPQGRESPYTFRPTPLALPFPLVPPAHSLAPAEVERLDAQASSAHVFLIGLVGDYRSHHGGAVPDRIDPDDLRVELLASGKPWPTNPYGGDPVPQARVSGGAAWNRCTPTTARYTGYGFDGPLVGESFGAGCG